MADPNLTIGIEKDGSGGKAKYIPPERMDEAISRLRQKGIPYRVMEDVEEAETPSFLSFGKEAEEPMHAEVAEDPDLMEAGSRRLKSPETWEQIGERDMVVAGEGERELIQSVPQYATSPEQKAHRSFQRTAQRQVNKRPAMLSFHGYEGQESRLNPLVTYDHFEPSLEQVMKKTKDPDDLAGLRQDGYDSEAYKAYADWQWKEVHDTYQKHGLAAVRVDQANPGFQAYGSAMENAVMPAMYGFDMVRSFGLGRQVMSSVAEEHFMSPAEKELTDKGVTLLPADRTKDMSQKSLIGTTIGYVAGSKGMIGRGAGRLIEKGAEAGGRLGGLAAGGGVAIGEQIAEELVEGAGELFRGAPQTPVSGTELVMTGMFGAGARGVGEAAGGISNRLMAGSLGDPLRQMQTLTGERPTSVLGHMGINEPSAVRAMRKGTDAARKKSQLARDDAMRAARELPKGEARDAAVTKAEIDFPISSGTPRDVLVDPAKRSVERLHVKESEAIKRWEADNSRFYKDNETNEVSTDGVLKRLEELYDRGAGFSPEGQVSDLPFASTDELGKLIEQFQRFPQMNAKDFDTSLQSLQEIIYDRGRSGSKMYKEIEQAMMETRAKFGPEWAGIKLRHKNEQVDLMNSFDAMGQRGIEKNADLMTSVERAAGKAAKLGLNAADDEAWYRIIRDEPGLLEQMKQAAAYHPHQKLTTGQEVPHTMGAIIQQGQKRIDPVTGLIERTMNRAGPGLSSEAGTASERALSTAGGLESQVDNVRMLWEQLWKQIDKDDSNE